MPKREPIADRLWRKVDFSGDCWEWTGATTRGYGVIGSGLGNRMAYVHRVTYELLVGEIPAGFFIDHLCRNRRCVNPDHLEVVTHQTNVLRGYAKSAIRARITHCPKGHEYTPENTYTSRRGERSCRTCHADAERDRRARARGYAA